MDREAAENALKRLANRSAATWLQIRGEAFVGETTIETGNTIYRFSNGVFSGRAQRPTTTTDAGNSAAGANAKPNAPPLAWECPPSMIGVELIGFMADEGGLWSLSPRWRSGALAVITTKAMAFTLTSPTLSCTIERPEPVRVAPERSDVFDVPARRPPTVRRPAPPSMTRLQPLPPTPPAAR